jgi:hypothetical protein
VPDAFLREVAGFGSCRRRLRGRARLPPDDDQAERATMDRIGELAAEEQLMVLGWRDVPTAGAARCDGAVDHAPVPFVAADRTHEDGAGGPSWIELTGGPSACASGPNRNAGLLPEPVLARWSTRACSPPDSWSRSS